MENKTISYQSIRELLDLADSKSLRISDIILEEQSRTGEEPKELCFQRMSEHLSVMLSAIEKGSAANIRSTSGLSGGDAFKLYEKSEKEESLCGPLWQTV